MPASALDFAKPSRANDRMITRRDIFIAAISIVATVTVAALAQTAPKKLLPSSVFQWSDMKVQKTLVGERRAVFDAPTANLDQFECHITTLNPGESPHPPHRHNHEEMFIVKEGTLEATQNGRTNLVSAGGIIFCASEDLHGIHNASNKPVTYYVLAWYPPGVKDSPAK